jgi:histidine ammonia-lyase
VIENTYQVTAIQYMALAQATDCLKITEKLSPTARRIYEAIRKIMPVIVQDAPLYQQIASVEEYLKQHPLQLK